MMFLHLTTPTVISLVFFGFISCVTATRIISHQEGIRSNVGEVKKTLFSTKTVKPKRFTFARRTLNQSGESQIKRKQRQFTSTKRQKFERNNLLKSHSKISDQQKIQLSTRKLTKKQFIPHYFTDFPGGAWLQDSSNSRQFSVSRPRGKESSI